MTSNGPLDAGDGHSARAEDAVLHGCIPVVIMDNVHTTYESILDWSKFSIRIPQVRIWKSFLLLPLTACRCINRSACMTCLRFFGQ